MIDVWEPLYTGVPLDGNANDLVDEVDRDGFEAQIEDGQYDFHPPLDEENN